MKKIATIPLFLFLFSLLVTAPAFMAKKGQEFYQIRVYHFANADQQRLLDAYLKDAYLPALHRNGIRQVGVFKPITNDTAADKTLYVIMPLKNLEQLVKMAQKLEKDKEYQQAATEYTNREHRNPPFTRMENILLQAFRLAPTMNLPQLKGPKEERIFELRSYEGPTEKLYRNKVQMFNEGGEIAIFKKLNFNAVFYADVISGSRMPNLMYMTSFENRADRDAHWRSFGADPDWKKLSSMPDYPGYNVSKNTQILMHPTDYSDY